MVLALFNFFIRSYGRLTVPRFSNGFHSRHSLFSYPTVPLPVRYAEDSPSLGRVPPLFASTHFSRGDAVICSSGRPLARNVPPIHLFAF